MKKTLTWDDLATFYKKKTGRSALIQPMDSIYDWAVTQREVTVNKDSSLSWKKGAVKLA